MTITTSSDFPFPESFRCVNCGHEHEYEDTTVRWDNGEILCEDVEACERRGFLVVDDGIDPGHPINPDPVMEEDCDPKEEASFPCDDIPDTMPDDWDGYAEGYGPGAIDFFYEGERENRVGDEG